MTELRIVEQTAYDPALATNYDRLLASLHMVENFWHEPEDIRAVCEGSTGILYLAYHGSSAVGMATLIRPVDSIGHRTALFEDIAVDPEYHGRGIATKLVEHLMAESSRLGATRIELQSNDTRVAAHGLYRKLGFEIIDTRLFRKDLD